MVEERITYVHDGKEVYLTGRLAEPNPNNPRTAKNVPMVEIVPVGTKTGDNEYAKWIKIEELMIIRNIEDKDFNDETE